MNASAYYSVQGTEIYLFSEKGDYGLGNVYLVAGERCQYWCPNRLEQQDMSDSLETYDFYHGAKYTGSSSIDGVKVDNYAWDEDLGPIVMNSLTLAVRPDTGAPVHQTRKLTPFGNFIGWSNSTWTTFTPGAPAASAFTVLNKEYCEQGNEG